MGIVRARLLVKGDKAEEDLSVLFDTGATRSIVNKAVAEGLSSPRTLVVPREIVVADGHRVKAEQLVDLAVEVSGRLMGIEAFIVDNLPEQLIFGALDMETYTIKLDLREKRLDLSEFSPHMLAV